MTLLYCFEVRCRFLENVQTLDRRNSLGHLHNKQERVVVFPWCESKAETSETPWRWLVHSINYFVILLSRLGHWLLCFRPSDGWTLICFPWPQSSEVRNGWRTLRDFPQHKFSLYSWVVNLNRGIKDTALIGFFIPATVRLETRCCKICLWYQLYDRAPLIVGAHPQS